VDNAIQCQFRAKNAGLVRKLHCIVSKGNDLPHKGSFTMRTTSFFTVLFLIVSVASMPLAAIAGPNKGASYTEESVCDSLKADDVPPALYGLCIAYCEDEAKSPRVLENYLSKSGDVPPPCEQVSCPCWTVDELGNAFEGLTPLFCVLDENELDFAVYSVFEGYLGAGFDTQSQSVLCEFIDPTQGDAGIDRTIGLSEPEEEVCRSDVRAMIGMDFPGGC